MIGVLDILINRLDRTLIQEVWDLDGVVQDAKHHPEGDALQHTFLVVEAAENIARRELLRDFESHVLINAALGHDLGKVSTTVIQDDGRITAYGHDEASVPLAKAMFERLDVDEREIEHTLPLIRYHMAHVAFGNNITQRAVKRLAKKLYPSNIYMWSLLVKADHCGRPPLECRLPPRAREVFLRAQLLGIEYGDLSTLQ